MTHMLQGQSAVEGEGDDLHDDRQKEQKDAEQVEGIERPTLEQRRVFWARAVFAIAILGCVSCLQLRKSLLIDPG